LNVGLVCVLNNPPCHVVPAAAVVERGPPAGGAPPLPELIHSERNSARASDEHAALEDPPDRRVIENKHSTKLGA